MALPVCSILTSMARLSVRVTPRGGRDRIEGFSAGHVLRVRVAAAPTDGEANEAVRRLLAKVLGLPPRDLTLVSGLTSRVKVFETPFSDLELIAKLETFT